MTVPAFVAAVHARSADGARAALSPAFAGKANGKPLDGDAQVRLLESFWQGFPDGNFAMEATGGSGRHVITWTFKGTHDGMYLGVPPTGKPVEFSGFIIAVSDATGITGLDWKWDTKVFTKAVLGPDDVGTLEVKDRFRADPSRRWSHGPPGGQRRKGKGKGPRPQQPAQPGQPGQPGEASAEGQPQPIPGQPGEGKRRRRRGKGPRPPGEAPNGPPNAPSPPNAGGDPVPSVDSVDGPAPSPASPSTERAEEPAPDPKPDGA